MPITGKRSIRIIHNAFLPVLMELFRASTMAIMSKTKTSRPNIPPIDPPFSVIIYYRITILLVVVIVAIRYPKYILLHIKNPFNIFIQNQYCQSLIFVTVIIGPRMRTLIVLGKERCCSHCLIFEPQH